eukprot:TRINITY_DN90711_c0_g1_i1.p1 TRINITY_DN90711_c0_g1~~TRINITY_DN90711_c0_g1_i1.p1  ORF type:complete len:915 (-),score=153.64 TRINITY_DN90711_c0_g1_i1:59-2803(-)
MGASASANAGEVLEVLFGSPVEPWEGDFAEFPPGTPQDGLEGMGGPMGRRKVNVRRLLWRLNFERRLLRDIGSLGIVVLLVVFLLTGVSELRPTSVLGAANRGLKTHFDLDAAYSVSSWDAVYGFAAKFASQADVARALNPRHYWCERRFFDIAWNGDLGLPQRQCQSPRYEVMDIEGHDPWNESQYGELYNTYPYIFCSDNTTGLQEYLGLDENATCMDDRNEYCNKIDVLVYCRRSCGYCFTFDYEYTNRFTERQLSITPAIFYQTRLRPQQCEGFADLLNEEATVRLAPEHWQGHYDAAPDMHGNVSNQSFECFHRHEGAQPCTAEVDSGCEEILPNIDASTLSLDGSRIYPELLSRPESDVGRLQQASWIDDRTDTVTVAALIYTGELDVFSYVGAEFRMSEAGAIDVNVFTTSYLELTNYALLIGRLIGILACMLIAVYLAVGRNYSNAFRALEAVVLVLTLLFMLGVLAIWIQLPLVSSAYEKLMYRFRDDSVLEARDRPWGSDVAVLRAFVDAANILLTIDSWQFYLQIGAFVVLFMLLAQALLYLASHPRLRLVADVVLHQFVDLVPYMLIFIGSFVCSALGAWIIFGPQVDGYATLQQALASQLRCLFGEALWDDSRQTRRLSWPKLVLYRSYSICWFLSAVWFGLTVLLANVVDTIGFHGLQRFRKGFEDTDAKLTSEQEDAEERHKEACTHTFLWDLYSCFMSVWMSDSGRKWPLPDPLAATVHKVCKKRSADDYENVTITLRELRREMPGLLIRKTELVPFLEEYNRRCRDTVMPPPPQRPVIIKPPPSDDVPPFVDIPFMDLEKQAQLRARVWETVERWLAWAPYSELPYEEIEIQLACAVTQEVLQSLVEPQKGPAGSTLKPAEVPAAPIEMVASGPFGALPLDEQETEEGGGYMSDESV